MSTICEIKYNVQLTAIRFCKYKLSINDIVIELTFPQLLQLRERVSFFTHPVKLSEIIDNENFVLLFIADKTHLIFLEIPQLLDLKDEVNYFFNQFRYK